MADERRLLSRFLATVFAGHERLTRDELRRRAVAAELPADVLARLEALPEGEYAEDEAAEALRTEEEP